MKPVLSKKIGWALLAALLLIDAFLDVVRGSEGNPLWKPILNAIGIDKVFFLVPPVLLLFYMLVRGCGWLIARTDKTPQAEELVLTALVVIYAIYDLWVLSVDFLGFRLITNFRLMTVPLTIAGLGYALLAQRKLKR